nr:helix-turn-helix transcriptional regulator [Shimia sp. R11_0]
MIDEAPEQFTSILSLAQTLGSNETTLQRQFRKAFDTTIFEYVLRRRMTCAQMLVRDGHLSISEISYRVGYNSPANFSTAYKRFFGFSPAQHRQGRTN